MGDGDAHSAERELVNGELAAGVDRKLATCDGARESVSLIDNVYSERLAPDQFSCHPGAVSPIASTGSVVDGCERPSARRSFVSKSP